MYITSRAHAASNKSPLCPRVTVALPVTGSAADPMMRRRAGRCQAQADSELTPGRQEVLKNQKRKRHYHFDQLLNLTGSTRAHQRTGAMSLVTL
jgi:hypothetical protein